MPGKFLESELDMGWLRKQFKQKSTWTGGSTLAALACMIWGPEQGQAISMGLAVLSNTYDVFRNEQ
jgi:hypothetical protein